MTQSSGGPDPKQALERSVTAVLRELADLGYPVTGQRRAMVALIMAQTKTFAADDLLQRLRSGGSRIGRATVFRTLDLLVCLGYVSRVPSGERQAYAVCGPGRQHHHHLICSNCGEVLHLDDCPITTMLSDLESVTGFQIENHHLEVAGICPSCRR